MHLQVSTTEELVGFVKACIPTFVEVRRIGPGSAFHYTSHADAIDRCGKFCGAPITPNLDRTQGGLTSNPASSDPDVVFAYLNINDTAEEGSGCIVYEIFFDEAVWAWHIQEKELGAPPTILILTSAITSFRRIGDADAISSQFHQHEP